MRQMTMTHGCSIFSLLLLYSSLKKHWDEKSRDKICQITSDTLVPTLVSQILAAYAPNDHGQWRSNDLCNARDKICQITSDPLISQIFFYLTCVTETELRSYMKIRMLRYFKKDVITLLLGISSPLNTFGV